MGLLLNAYRYCEACGDPSRIAEMVPGTTVIPLVRDNDHGYIAIEPTRLVACFAGSDDLKDWISNLKFMRLREGNTIHEGFYDTWKAFKDECQKIVIQYLIDCQKEKKDTVICSRGHSRGAAVAAMFIRDVAKNLGIDCSNERSIVFGMPQIGNEQAQDEFNALPINFITVENGLDPICHVPLWDMGFREWGRRKIKIQVSPLRNLPIVRSWNHIRYREELEKKDM